MKNRKTIIIILFILFVIFLTLGIILYLRKNNNKVEIINDSNEKTDIIDINNTDDKNIYDIEYENISSSNGNVKLIVNVKKDLIKTGDVIRGVNKDNKVIDMKVISIENLPNYSTETVRLGIVLDSNNLSYYIVSDCSKFTTKRIDSLSYLVETNVNLDCKTNTKEEGGRHTPFFDRYSPNAEINGIKYKTLLDVLDKEKVIPGEDAKILMTIYDEVNVNNNSEISLTDGNTKVGTCKVINSEIKTYKYENNGYIVKK